jgi:cysteine desulfurase
VKLTAQIDGGGHEKAMRSGTLNVPGIVGFGKASEICMSEMNRDAEKTGRLRDKLENELLHIEEVSVNGNKEHRLPHVSNMAFRGAEAETLMMALSKEVAVSSGSACMSASLEPSYVLKALGLTDEMARSSLRFSLGRNTSEQEIDHTIKIVNNSIHKLRRDNPQFQIVK